MCIPKGRLMKIKLEGPGYEIVDASMCSIWKKIIMGADLSN